MFFWKRCIEFIAPIPIHSARRARAKRRRAGYRIALEALEDRTVPAAPPTLVAPVGPIMNATPTFIWNAASGASYYDIQVDDVTTGQMQVLRNTHVNGTSWVASAALNLGQTYEWSVRYFTSTGVASAWSTPDEFNVINPFAGDYSGTFTGNTTEGPVTGSVSASVSATGAVTVTEPGPGTGTVDLTGGTVMTGTFGFGTVTDAGYTFTGTLTVSGGNVNGTGAWTATWVGGSGAGTWTVSATPADLQGTPLDTPTQLAPSGTILNAKPALAWNYVTGATSYDISVDDLTTGQTGVLQNPAATGEWQPQTTLAPMPTARSSVAVAALDGILYVAGGSTATVSQSNLFEAYNPATNTWQTLPPLPTAVSDPTVIGFNHKLYVFGGWSGSLPTTGVQIYDPSTNSWSAGATMPTRSAGAESGVINGKIYVLTMLNGFSTPPPGFFKIFNVYDPTTNTWATGTAKPPDAPNIHGGGVAGVIGDKFYVAGGGAWGSPTNYLDVYDPAVGSNGTWTTLTAMPTARSGCAGGVLNGLLYVTGGATASGTALTTVQAYDPISGTWSAQPSLPTAHNMGGGAVIGSTLYVVGGAIGASAKIGTLDAFTSTWTPATPLTPGHSYHWWVTAQDNVGNTSPTAGPMAFNLNILATPTLIGPTGSITSTAPAFSWSAVTGADTYRLWVHDITTGSSATERTVMTNNYAWPAGTPLVLGHSYEWRVEALSNNGNVGMWSDPTSFAVIVASPTPLAPTGSTQNLLPTFSWNAVANAQRYDMRMDDVTNGQAQVLRNSYVYGTSLTTTTRLTPGHQYQWWVRAIAANGVASTWSSATTFNVTMLDTPVLSAPLGYIQNGTPTFQWSAVTGATAYDVWVDDLTTGQAQLLRNANVSGTFWTPNATLVLGHTYQWKVQARNNNGNNSVWSNWATFTESNPFAGSYAGTVTGGSLTTTAISLVVGTTGLVTVPTPVSGAYPGNGRGSVSLNGTTTIRGTGFDGQATATYTLTGSFTIALGVASASGTWVATSGGSGTWSVTATNLLGSPLDTPTQLAPTGSILNAEPTLSWNPVSRATSYAISVDDLTTGQTGVLHDAFATGWQTQPTLPTMPTARSSVAVAAVNGILYVAGGSTATVAQSNLFQAYNPATNTWQTLPSLPIAVSDATAIAFNGELYVFGGWSGSIPTNRVQIYSPTTRSWRYGTAMPTLSAGAEAGVINGKIYVLTMLNGYSTPPPGFFKIFNVYDPVANTWTSLPDAPNIHGGGAAGVIHNKLYVAGGGAWGAPNNYLDVYDPNIGPSGTWTTLTPMPTVRSGCAGGVLNGELYVAGGATVGGTPLSTVEAYDPVTDTWSTQPSMPAPHNMGGGDVIGSTLYVVGGSNSGGAKLATLEAFRRPDIWTAATPLTPGHDYQWWVTAQDNAGNCSPTAGPMAFDLSLLDAPTLTGPTGSIASTAPTFSWSAVTGADSYRLWVHDISTGYSATERPVIATSYAWPAGTPLVLGHSYEWRVQALSNNGNIGVWSAPTYCAVILASPTPIAPTGSTQSVLPAFSWSAVIGAQRYDLRVDDVTTGQTQVVRYSYVYAPNTTFTTTTRLTPAHQYQWWVRAIAANGVASTWSAATVFSVAPLSKPALVSPVGMIQNGTPKFQWSAVTGATIYDVWVNDLTTGQQQVLRNPNVAAPATSWTFATALVVGHSYQWKIQARNASGNTSVWSDWATFTYSNPFAGTYTGTFIGDATGSIDASIGVSGAIVVDNPGSGQGTINFSGGSTFSGTGFGIYLDATYTFTGNFVIAGGVVTGSGAWDARYSGGTAHGTWTVMSSHILGTPLDTPVLTAPSGNITGLEPTFTWNPVTGANYYDVWVDDITAARYAVMRNNHVTTNSWAPWAVPPLPADLIPGHVYQWKVEALNNQGDTSAWSSPTEFTVVTAVALTVPTPVDPLTGAFPTPTVTFRWTTVSGAAYYDVQVIDVGTGNQVLRNLRVSGGSWSGVLTSGHSYRWHVRAFNSTGTVVSDWSTDQTFVVA